MSQSIINARSFAASLSRIGKTPDTLNGMARFALFHGARGQFTPANQLTASMSDAGMSKGDAARACADMLAEGLREFATMTGLAFKGRKGAEYMGEDGATAHAIGAKGVPARMAEFVDARAKAKADKVAKAKAEPAPAEGEGDAGADGDAAANLAAARAAQAGTLESRVSEADRSEIAARAVAEQAEYVRIARSNHARAYAMQLKAEQETLDAVRASEAAQREAARLSVELATVRAELDAARSQVAELETLRALESAQAMPATAPKARKGARAVAHA